jgi:PAS domain S-box-containing protein
MPDKTSAAESALRDPQQLYQDLVETSQDLIWQCDSEGRYTYLNPAWETTFGYTIKEMLGRKFTDFQTPEMAERDMREHIRLMQGSMLKGFETIHIGQAGQEIHLIFNAKHVLDENGAIIGTRGTAHDITERRKAEKASAESQLKFRLVFEQSRDAIGVSLNGVHVFVNPAYVAMFGYANEEELKGVPILSLIDPVCRPDIKDKIRKRTSKEQLPVSYETRGLRKDGTPFAMDVNASAFDLHGEIHTLVVLRDITERKRVEQALHDSETIFKQFMDNSPIYVFFKDEQIRPIRLSKNFEKMLGKPIDELLGKSMDDLFPSELAKSMVADDKRILSEGKQITVQEELNGRSYTTTKFPIHVDGKPRYLAGYVIDITERKQADAKLLQAKEYSENLIRTANAIVVGLDVSGQVNVFNRTAEEITGYGRADLEGRNWFEVLVPRERYPQVWQEFERLTTAGIPKVFENPILTKHGQERYISWQNAVLSEHGKVTGTISFGIDITDRKSAEAKLQHHLTELKARNDELTRFNRVATDRELRMIELKREINNLCSKLGLPQRYTVAVDLDSPEEQSGAGQEQSTP